MVGMRRSQTRPAGATALRPRYRRILAAGTSAMVTLVAVLGSTGVLPIGATHEPAFAGTMGPAKLGAPTMSLGGSASTALPSHPEFRDWTPTHLVTERRRGPVESEQKSRASAARMVPERSGEGKRIVFDIGDQRVWLVSAKERVRRTYLVSGSLTDNLGPGTYEVFSKSRHAIGIDDSGTMQYMVRFTHGVNAAIGFHDIPVHDGEKVQTRRQLGTPQSHGCVRQLRKDAKALWRFAPIGTTVVVRD